MVQKNSSLTSVNDSVRQSPSKKTTTTSWTRIVQSSMVNSNPISIIVPSATAAAKSSNSQLSNQGHLKTTETGSFGSVGSKLTSNNVFMQKLIIYGEETYIFKNMIFWKF